MNNNYYGTEAEKQNYAILSFHTTAHIIMLSIYVIVTVDTGFEMILAIQLSRL